MYQTVNISGDSYARTCAILLRIHACMGCSGVQFPLGARIHCHPLFPLLGFYPTPVRWRAHDDDYYEPMLTALELQLAIERASLHRA